MPHFSPVSEDQHHLWLSGE